MTIERRFYDLAKAQWDEISEKVRQEKENRTDAEREFEKLKSEHELQEIFRKSEEHARHWKRVPDEKKIQLFRRVVEQALWMAEHISCNIIVEENENSLGKIILESEGFVITSFWDRAINSVFANLFLAADDACVDNSSTGLCKMEFYFRLYREMPVDQNT